MSAIADRAPVWRDWLGEAPRDVQIAAIAAITAMTLALVVMFNTIFNDRATGTVRSVMETPERQDWLSDLSVFDTESSARLVVLSDDGQYLVVDGAPAQGVEIGDRVEVRLRGGDRAAYGPEAAPRDFALAMVASVIFFFTALYAISGTVTWARKKGRRA